MYLSSENSKMQFLYFFFQVCKCCETTHILAIKCNISMFHSSIFNSSCKDSAVLSFSLPEMTKKKSPVSSRKTT